MIYHYFGSKSHLYIAVLEEALAGLRRRSFRSTSSISIRARACCNCLISWRAISRITGTGAPAFGGKFAESQIHAQIRADSGNVIAGAQMIEQLIARGTKAGQLPQDLTDCGSTF